MEEQLKTVGILIDEDQMERLMSDLQQAYKQHPGSVMLYTTRHDMSSIEDALNQGDYVKFMAEAPAPELVIVESIYTIAFTQEPDGILEHMRASGNETTSW